MPSFFSGLKSCNSVCGVAEGNPQIFFTLGRVTGGRDIVQPCQESPVATLLSEIERQRQAGDKVSDAKKRVLNFSFGFTHYFKTLYDSLRCS